ncbi:MAG TPA: hypothetical protein VLM18_08850 [Croceibacterium sp.]|nr:hypothetical protein [Croceibacterium sp.]
MWAKPFLANCHHRDSSIIQRPRITAPPELKEQWFIGSGEASLAAETYSFGRIKLADLLGVLQAQCRTNAEARQN